jgi:hypothetical protein
LSEYDRTRPLVLPVQIWQSGTLRSTYALLDSGAEGLGFIDKNWAEDNEIQLCPRKHPFQVEDFHGESVEEGWVTHDATVTMEVQGHREDLLLHVVSMGRFPIILGIAWLKLHDPVLCFSGSYMIFNSVFCHERCNAPILTTRIRLLQDVPRRARPREVLRPARHAPDTATTTRAVDPSEVDIQRVSLRACAAFARRPGYRIFQASLEDVEAALSEETKPTLDDLLPEELRDFRDVFCPKEADKLPPHRPYDHDIKLIDGKTPPFGPLYPMSRVQLTVLKEWLDENLEKGFIRPSSSPAASPVLFVSKPRGGLRLCMDYRALNAVTVKDRYPLPLTKETLNNLKGMRYFSTIDIVSAFNNIRMKKGMEYLTAFRTRFGLFESLVMPFGLTGAPATFQRFMNDTLREFLDVFCNAYMDDILVYSRTRTEHERHLRLILEKLREAGLHVKIEKCHFFQTEVKFLGLIVGTSGVRMDPEKIRTIVEWKQPRNVTDIKSFTGFAGFYRRFIKNFSKILAPITALEKKGIQFRWTDECQQSFDYLKAEFTKEPILRAFDWEQVTTVETDSSDYVSAGAMSQPDENGVLHPVAFYSKKLTPTECNYEIYDKELLAIVRCLEE